jgi:8-amino-7-oxononanoate synthase
MADFTNALYLGMRHASASLPGWEALTLGRPAVLAEPHGALDTAAALAQLQGMAAATLLPSTLHLFWDLLRQLARQSRVALLLDAGAYPILHWAAEGAAAVGAQVRRFAHHDAAALAQLAEQALRAGLRPVILCDGFCTGCNRAAPLPAYARIAALSGGTLVLDDTQALGVLGHTPSSACPYGHGGGGSLRWHGLSGAHVMVGASLAKGFGAPLAALSGDAPLIERFAQDSQTRLHCSPPSIASVQAAQAALMANAPSGARWRARLLHLVQRLRTAVMRAGLDAVGTLPFPVQSFVSRHAPGAAAFAQLLQRLRAGGVQALLTRGCQGLAPRLTFIVTARHSAAQIDRAAALLAGALRA